MVNQSFKQMLYKGATTRLIVHTMVWHNGKHTVDPKRKEGYVSSDPNAVYNMSRAMQSAGFDIDSPNWYGPGTSNKDYAYIDQCTKVLFANSVLNHIINIDGTPITSQATLLNLVDYIRQNYFPSPAYEKHNGKYVVTIFNKEGHQRSWFAAAEKANLDTTFVYTDSDMGNNRMAWVHKDLELNADWWIRTFGLRKDGSLNIPCATAGMDDTNSITGYGVWGDKPARVYPPGPPGPGPNWDTLRAFFAVINKYYSTSNQLDYLQAVTGNDADEGSNMWKRGFILPSPVPKIYHLETWLDGKKISNVPLFNSSGKFTVNQVDQNENVAKSADLVIVKDSDTTA